MTQAVIQTTVTGMQGRPIATTVPTANQAYTWSGTAWVPTGPYLPLAGGIVTGALRVQYSTPSIIYNDTSTSITAGGLWRELNSAGGLQFQSNSATAGDFSTAVTPLALSNTGGVTVGNGLTVNGNQTVSGSLTAAGTVQGVNVIMTSAFICAGGATITNQNGGWVWNTSGATFTYMCDPTIAGTFQWNRAGIGNLMTLDGVGSLDILGTLTQGSDATNKTNINPITQGISLIRQLIPKSFAWNAVPDVTNWGFIAQDVQSVIPDAVNQKTEGSTLGLDITAILAAVTFAVKQLDQRCTALESHDGITPPAAQLA